MRSGWKGLPGYNGESTALSGAPTDPQRGHCSGPGPRSHLKLLRSSRGEVQEGWGLVQRGSPSHSFLPGIAQPPPTHRSWSRSCVSFSRAFRCRMHTSFCCRGVRYCSGVGGLMPWLSLHSVYFMERLQGDADQRGGRKRPGGAQALCFQGQGEPGLTIQVPRPQRPCGHEDSRPFWKGGFIKALLREEHSIRVGSSRLL